jgi:hypothetical protein
MRETLCFLLLLFLAIPVDRFALDFDLLSYSVRIAAVFGSYCGLPFVIDSRACVLGLVSSGTQLLPPHSYNLSI